MELKNPEWIRSVKTTNDPEWIGRGIEYEGTRTLMLHYSDLIRMLKDSKLPLEISFISNNGGTEPRKRK